jgi:hypothetical protein
MGRLLRRFADPIVRRQLQRALAARDYARGEVRRLEKRLRAEQLANQSLRQITDRWQSIAIHRATELAATEQMLRVTLADEQGEKQ